MTDILTHAGINGASLLIIGYFLKRLIASNDKKHAKATEKIEEIEKKFTDSQLEIKVSLANINGQMTQALSSIGQIELLKEKVWGLNSKVDAAFRILDQKRSSDV